MPEREKIAEILDDSFKYISRKTESGASFNGHKNFRLFFKGFRSDLHLGAESFRYKTGQHWLLRQSLGKRYIDLFGGTVFFGASVGRKVDTSIPKAYDTYNELFGKAELGEFRLHWEGPVISNSNYQSISILLNRTKDLVTNIEDALRKQNNHIIIDNEMEFPWKNDISKLLDDPCASLRFSGRDFGIVLSNRFMESCLIHTRNPLPFYVRPLNEKSDAKILMNGYDRIERLMQTL